jgi:hypothetical protein
MKLLAHALVLAAVQTASPAGITGTWVVPDTPWSIVLKQEGATLTGKVVQGVQENEIYDATIEGTTVSFKAMPPTKDRVITFVGKLQGDEMAFTRTVEIKPGGGPGGVALMGGLGGPPEFKVRRAVPDTDVWSGTARNMPTAPNPNPRPASVAMRMVADPHWQWRGETKERATRVLVQNNQATPLNAFTVDNDRVTFEYSQGPQAAKWTCALGRQADGTFVGACRPENAPNPNAGFLLTLTPPKEPAKHP